MNIQSLQRHWERFARHDPRYAIMTDPARRNGGWDDTSFLDTGRKDIDRILTEMERVGLSCGRHRALDFGCGEGRLAQALAGHFDRVDGVDIAPSMIRGANALNRYGPKVSYHLNARPDLSIFPDRSFDLVYSYITLHHMEPRYQQAYIGEFIRITSPSGLVVFHLPYEMTVRRIRERLKHAAPWLFAAYQYIRHGTGAVMEVYPTPRNTVERWVTEAGGSVAHVQDGIGTATMPGAHYYIRPSH